MSKLEILREWTPITSDKQTINESKETYGKIMLKGIIQRANTLNQNGRVYPREVLLKEVQKYSENQVTERRALGELDHPESSVVNLNNASHNIIEMHWDGDDLLGTVEVLGTPSGNILKELFRSGIKLGISSRGLGSVETIKEEEEGEEDTVEVQPDFELIAFDFVSNQSTHGAFMRPVNESVQPKTPENNIERIVNSIMRG